MRPYIFISLISILSIYCDTDNEEWISLFDGESLSGWEMKIAGYELNNNYRNTFSVKDGVIRVSYSDYDSFDEKFGHLFYTKKKFKNYHLKMDYRFYGEHANQLKNEDEAWNYKNSGVMLHSEDPSKIIERWTSEILKIGGSPVGNPKLENFGSEQWMFDPEGNQFLILVPYLSKGSKKEDFL